MQEGGIKFKQRKKKSTDGSVSVLVMNMRHMAIALGALSSLSMAGTGREQGIDPDSINAGNDFNSHIPRGVKEYHFYGHTVYAINEKNAIRKAKKLRDASR